MSAGAPATRDRTAPPMTFAETAEALGLDKVSKDPRRMVQSLCRKGLLRPIRVGRFVLVAAESVEAFLKGR